MRMLRVGLLLLVYANLALAAESQKPPAKTPPNPSYGEQVGDKLAHGFANTTLSIIEVPKAIINTSNETNLMFGITGGLMKGLLHFMGRTMVGVIDVVSFPIPTQPIANPVYPWSDFRTETRYGKGFDTGNAASTTSKDPMSRY